MKVHELIKALQEMPQNAEVQTEGCDCYGDTNSVSIMEGFFNTVMIWRSDSDFVLAKESYPKFDGTYKTSDEDLEVELIEYVEPKKLSDLE